MSAREKAELVTAHFSSIARKYDFMNTLLSGGLHYVWKRQAVQMLAIQPGNRVIDVCGGTADLAILAGRQVGPAGKVVLYDMNLDMIETGRPKISRKDLQARIVHVQGDAERISARDESFDVAMVGFGIRNLTHVEKGFQEMHRVLRPGGKLMCLEFSKPSAPWFRKLYDLYSFSIMPLVGQLLTGSRQAYTYLPESIRLFPEPDQLSAMLERIGFHSVTYRRLTNGIAVVHLGVKRTGSGFSKPA